MPQWIPQTLWLGQECFIIGGGDSLRGFDWELLKGKLTIGCNDAYIVNPTICVFGDAKEQWMQKHSSGLGRYVANGGFALTNQPRLVQRNPYSWLHTIGRRGSGLHKDALGWNNNTGALAINLALVLGAKKIYLLGYDLGIVPGGKANWYSDVVKPPNHALFAKFTRGFGQVEKDRKILFPNCEVVNVSDVSKLEVFPKVGFKQFWKERNKV